MIPVALAAPVDLADLDTINAQIAALHTNDTFDLARAVTDTRVHFVIPGFKAAREFCGRHDTCGPNALNELAAALWPSKYGPVGCATMNKITVEMQQHGQFSTDPRGVGGCTMFDLHEQAVRMGFAVTYLLAWHWHPALDLAMVHAIIKSVRYDQGYGVLLQVGRAYNLPDNEHGVDSHFVALGGVDSDQGYLVGNGDIPLGTFHGAEWASWASIAAAQPTAMMIVHHPVAGSGPAEPPPPPPPTNSIVDELRSVGYTDSANFDPSVFEASLTHPNGHKFTHGYRADVLAHGLAVDDTPLMDEASDGTVTTLVCTRTTFEWSQAAGVTRRETTPVGRVLAYTMQIRNTPAPKVTPASPRQIAAESLIAALKGVLDKWEQFNA